MTTVKSPTYARPHPPSGLTLIGALPLAWFDNVHSSENLFFYIFQGTVASLLTASQLHKRAERVAQMAVEQGRLSSGDNVALLFTPGMYLTNSETTLCQGSLSLQGRRRRKSLGTRL